MGYASESRDRRRGLPAGLALIVIMVLAGALGAPAPSFAASISCGQCHGIYDNGTNAGTSNTTDRRGVTEPGYESSTMPTVDNGIRGLHGVHMNYSSTTYAASGTQTVNSKVYSKRGNCNYCHNGHPRHATGFVNFTGTGNVATSARQPLLGTGTGPNKLLLTYTSAGRGVSYKNNIPSFDSPNPTGSCTMACHKGTSRSNPAPWGNITSASVKLSCSSCHGDQSNTAGMSGAHAAHVGSTIPTGGIALNAPDGAGCVICHPDNRNDFWKNGKADDGTKKAYPHAKDGTNVVPANAFVNTTVIGSGTRADLNTTCSAACHKNTTTAKWSDGSLACDACHYQETTPTSAHNAAAVVALGGSHGKHFDQAGICASCHAVPGAGDTTHVTALPVNAANATVSSGLTYSTTTKTCSSTGTSCHGTGMTTPAWGNPLGLAECTLCHEYPNSSNTWASGNTHLKHITASQFNAATDVYTSVVKSQTKCGRCHNGATHRSGTVEVSSALAPGLTYNTTNQSCANACHKNKNEVWGTASDCNTCHYRSGAIGGVAPSGLHVMADRSFKHYSSPIKVIDNTKTITCANCHPNNDADTGSPKNHIRSTDFVKRADMSEAHTYVTVTGIGYTKGATALNGTCAKSCHYNPTDPFGGYTICFKPGQKRQFGAYQTAAWGDSDLKCNECHSTPSQEATFGNLTSTAVYGGYTTAASRHANKRHEAHMFKYKLNLWNFANEDRNIYCDDCHRTPDINTLRGFRNHSTLGQGGSGVISLPVKSQNAKVNLSFRNNNIGRDGATPATFVRGSCSNVYCHTVMTKGEWTSEACDSCHGVRDGVDPGSGAPGYLNWTTNFRTFEEYSGGGGAHYTHVMKRGYACRTCHYDGGGDGNPLNHHNIATQSVPVGDRVINRANVNVGVEPQYWFNNRTSLYDKSTRTCSDVSCHYGVSQNWDCTPLH